MKTTIKVLATLLIFFAFACGGKETKKKAAVDPVNPLAEELALGICSCVDSIAISAEEVDDYNGAVKRCFEDVIFASNDSVDVKIRDLLNATEKTCPESYQLYSDIQGME